MKKKNHESFVIVIYFVMGCNGESEFLKITFILIFLGFFYAILTLSQFANSILLNWDRVLGYYWQTGTAIQVILMEELSSHFICPS